MLNSHIQTISSSCVTTAGFIGQCSALLLLLLFAAPTRRNGGNSQVAHGKSFSFLPMPSTINREIQSTCQQTRRLENRKKQTRGFLKRHISGAHIRLFRISLTAASLRAQKRKEQNKKEKKREKKGAAKLAQQLVRSSHTSHIGTFLLRVGRQRSDFTHAQLCMTAFSLPPAKLFPGALHRSQRFLS